MSHHREAHSLGFEKLSQGVYECKKIKGVHACELVCMRLSSRSVHAQACVSLGLGVTGGRYAMSWLTRVLLCCSVLHD